MNFFQTTNQDIILTNDQQKVVDGIIAHPKRVALLHGVTGSGKTEVYLALARYFLNKQKSVMMLVPEISLTPMMVKVFKERFWGTSSNFTFTFITR